MLTITGNNRQPYLIGHKLMSSDDDVQDRVPTCMYYRRNACLLAAGSRQIGHYVTRAGINTPGSVARVRNTKATMMYKYIYRDMQLLSFNNNHRKVLDQEMLCSALLL